MMVWEEEHHRFVQLAVTVHEGVPGPWEEVVVLVILYGRNHREEEAQQAVRSGRQLDCLIQEREM
jgi:hypothetical protein